MPLPHPLLPTTCASSNSLLTRRFKYGGNQGGYGQYNPYGQQDANPYSDANAMEQGNGSYGKRTTFSLSV